MYNFQTDFTEVEIRSVRLMRMTWQRCTGSRRWIYFQLVGRCGRLLIPSSRWAPSSKDVKQFVHPFLHESSRGSAEHHHASFMPRPVGRVPHCTGGLQPGTESADLHAVCIGFTRFLIGGRECIAAWFSAASTGGGATCHGLWKQLYASEPPPRSGLLFDYRLNCIGRSKSGAWPKKYTKKAEKLSNIEVRICEIVRCNTFEKIEKKQSIFGLEGLCQISNKFSHF